MHLQAQRKSPNTLIFIYLFIFGFWREFGHVRPPPEIRPWVNCYRYLRRCAHSFVNYSLRFFFVFAYLPSSNLRLKPPGTYNPIPVGEMPVEEYRLWTRTVDRTQDKGNTPNPRIWIKISDHAGNRTWVAGLEGRDSTDHASATYMLVILW